MFFHFQHYHGFCVQCSWPRQEHSSCYKCVYLFQANLLCLISLRYRLSYAVFFEGEVVALWVVDLHSSMI